MSTLLKLGKNGKLKYDGKSLTASDLRFFSGEAFTGKLALLINKDTKGFTSLVVFECEKEDKTLVFSKLKTMLKLASLGDNSWKIEADSLPFIWESTTCQNALEIEYNHSIHFTFNQLFI